MQHSTIAAIATAPGAGGIAIVRLSGPESYEVAAKVFRPANPAKKVADAKGYTAMFGAFVEGEEAFDEGVEKGYWRSLNALGDMYRLGEEVEEDGKKALSLYRKAEEMHSDRKSVV